MDPKDFHALVSEITNALQAALLLSARLEIDTRQNARDAADLRAAVERAATAAFVRRPNGDGEQS